MNFEGFSAVITFGVIAGACVFIVAAIATWGAP